MRCGIRLILLVFVLIVLILVFMRGRHSCMEMPVHVVERWESIPHHSDVIFIHLGDAASRSLYAARLYHEGHGSVIAMGSARPKRIAALGLVPCETAIACSILSWCRVPKSDIHVIPFLVSSTFDEARIARDWAEESGADSILFVTSSYHSARTSWIVRRVFKSSGIHISVAALPVPEIDWRPWWETEAGMVTVFNEIAKYVYYRLIFRNYHD